MALDALLRLLVKQILRLFQALLESPWPTPAVGALSQQLRDGLVACAKQASCMGVGGNQALDGHGA
tara:strand:+ start:18501 stop:18698 length:198 start_codon:yes stop_codon:yes gene_type:complete